MTSSCSAGGKAPRSTGTRSILKASVTVLEIARSPKNDRVATATKLVGNLQIGRLILGGQPQDQLTAEDQGLRRGVGSDERLQPIVGFALQDKHLRKGVWHDGHPWGVANFSGGVQAAMSQ